MDRWHTGAIADPPAPSRRVRLPRLRSSFIAGALLLAALPLAGCTGQETPPTASLTIDPNPTSGQTVTLDATASQDGKDPMGGNVYITQYEWDLDGNGTYETTTQSPTVTHTYTGTESVNVGLRVTDEYGYSGTTTATLTTDSKTNETAMTPSSNCTPAPPPPFACGTAAVGSPLGSSADAPTPVAQPDYSQMPVFDKLFPASDIADPGALGERGAVASGGDRVFVLYPSGVVAIFDADTLQQTGQWSVGGATRDIAYYRGEVYVLLANGDVGVFDTAGTARRLLRTVDGAALGTSDYLSYGNLTVAWNEVWSTISLGEKTGAGVVVRDATTGVAKAVVIHRANSTCSLTVYGTDGSAHCADPQVSLTPEETEPWRTNTTAGISAVPEDDALISQCQPISRQSFFGLTLGRDTGSAQCVDARRSGYLMGTDAAWGQQHFVQARVGQPDWKSDARVYIDDYQLSAGAPDATKYRSVSMQLAREWSPQYSSPGNYVDVSYRAHETRIDWSGVLSQDPGSWLRSPSDTEDKCVTYVVSNGDVYVVGQRGEHWWNPSAVSSVELRVDGQAVSGKTSTTASGQFCLDTRHFSDGVHTLEIDAHLPNGTTVTRYNRNLRIDNSPPSGRLVEAETDAHATQTYSGVASDGSSGVQSWQLEVQPAGQTTWQDPCPAGLQVDSSFRYNCDWATAGAYPDGDYTVRAKIVDNASDGGNVGYTPTVQVTVDNAASDEVDVDSTDTSTPSNDPPETDFEPAIPANNPADMVDGTGDPNEPEPECAADDPSLQRIDPSYAAESTLPVGVPDPGAAIVEFLSLPGVPLIPATSFQQVSLTADSAVYAASQNGAIGAVIQVVRAPDGSWIADHFLGCSQFPSQTAAVTNALP